MIISKVDKAKLFAALYNAAGPTDLLENDPHHKMTEEEALIILPEEDFEIGDFNGRSINIDFSGSKIDPHKYNMNNGQNKAEDILFLLRVCKNNDQPV